MSINGAPSDKQLLNQALAARASFLENELARLCKLQEQLKADEEIMLQELDRQKKPLSSGAVDEKKHADT